MKKLSSAFVALALLGGAWSGAAMAHVSIGIYGGAPYYGPPPIVQYAPRPYYGPPPVVYVAPPVPHWQRADWRAHRAWREQQWRRERWERHHHGYR